MMPARHKSFFWVLLLIGLCAAPAAAAPGHGARGSDVRIDDKFAVAQAGSDTSGARPAVRAATDHIQNARMFYWLGIEEAGNLRAFRQSQTYLDKAAESLAAATVADTRREELRNEIDALRANVAHQRTLAEGTFYGSFPLVRLLVPTLFVTSGSASNYHLVEDPGLMAVRELAQSIRDDVMSNWTTVPNMHVVFRGGSPVLKSEFLRAFNESARFYVHSDEEVTQTLADSTLAAFRTEGSSAPVIRTLRSAFGSPLAVVSLTRPNRVGNAHMYQSTAAVYGESATAPSHSIAQSTTVRDRRGQALPLLLCNLLLLVLAVSAYLWTARSRNEEFSLSFVVYPTLAFLIARFLFAVVYPVLEPLAPAPKTPTLVSLWWPLLVGFVLFIGLPAFVWFTADRYGLRPDGYGGPLLLAAALGAVAYVATPLFLWSTGGAWGLLAVTAVAAGAGAYLVGSALDEVHGLPRASALLPAAGALLLGGVLLHAHGTALILTCAALTASYAGLFWYADPVPSPQDSSSPPSDPEDRVGDAGPTDGVPSTRQELLDALQAPSYVPFSSFDEADRDLGQTSSRLMLTGPSGVGKTATAEKLLENRRPDATVLSGSCSKPLGEPIPFEPFREALEAHFELEAYTRDNVQAQHEQIASMFDEVFESFVPFVSMLSPPLESSTSGADSRHEIFRAVTRALREIATHRPVYLFIDDLQWADTDSLDLLRHLLEEFPSDSDDPVHFLFACRTDESEDLSGARPGSDWDGTDLTDHVVELSPPTKEQQTKILTSSLGLEPEAAEKIVRRVDTEGPGSRGQLFWLFEVVRHLAQNGILQSSDDAAPGATPEKSSSTEGFALSDSFDAETLPVPTQFQAVIGEELEEHPRYRRPLAYAACLGQTFRASTLTEILGQSRFEVLSLLRDIQRDTGWIRDVQSKDDVYEFSSSYLLEGMREHFEIQEAGPTDAAPQLIREYHAQAARALEAVETEIGESQRDQIANHYYAAGASHAERAYQACLSASRAMRSIYSFKQAHAFLDKARDCADVAGLDGELEEEALRLTCFEAHIKGDVSFDEDEPALQGVSLDEDETALQRAVEEGTTYLDHADAPSLETVKAVAQVCYDRARSARKGEYFQKAKHWGEYLFEHGDSPVLRAEGHHFIGISLPPKPETRDEREEHLQKALALLNDVPEPDPETKRLRGRVMNSLANLLSDEDSDSDEREEARALYERRIELNETHKLGDLQGLAMSHGGLGRLLMHPQAEVERSDVEAAKKHFKEDLRLAEEIGDVGGQAQMHSHLGECALRLSNNGEASDQYKLSLEKASAWTSECFALAGLLITCARQDDTEGVTTYGRQLVETIQWDSLFMGLENRIQEALEATAPLAEDRDWFQQIHRRLDAE